MKLTHRVVSGIYTGLLCVRIGENWCVSLFGRLVEVSEELEVEKLSESVECQLIDCRSQK